MAIWDVIVVGGGPAGLMAACHAAQRGRKTLLVEKRPRPGTKILLSGGTRCNVTHATDPRGIVEAFGPQGRFLHSALARLGPEALVDLLAAEGVPTKVEPGGKVFPQSDRAADVLAALLDRIGRTDCAVTLAEPVQDIQHCTDGFHLVTPHQAHLARHVILATGGQSYPASGSSGDGYRWAAALGHTVVTPRPALVPITTHATDVLALQGITMPDVRVAVREPEAKTCLAHQRGSLLFAHFGVSGPAVLDVSRAVSGHPQPSTLVLECDFLPDMKLDLLESALQAACGEAGKRRIAGVLAGCAEGLSLRLAETIAHRADVALDGRAAEQSRLVRHAMARMIKQFAIPIAGTMGFRKAEVTAGGVALDEVDSRTMQSKLVPGLFFAGELLDLDGPIGGYNFQAAFSTGWLAGEEA